MARAYVQKFGILDYITTTFFGDYFIIRNACMLDFVLSSQEELTS